MKKWKAVGTGQAGGIIHKPGDTFEGNSDYSHWAVEVDKDGNPVQKTAAKAADKAASVQKSSYETKAAAKTADKAADKASGKETPKA